MEQLTAKAPAQASWQRDLAVSHGKAGLVLVAEGDTVGAREAIRAGLAIMTLLVARDPTNADWQQDLAELYRANGDAAELSDNRASARGEYESCFAIIEPMLSRGSINKKLAELAAYCRSQATAAASNKIARPG
jgi:hypothetical protein